MNLTMNRTKDGSLKITAIVSADELEHYRHALRAVGVVVEPEARPLPHDATGQARTLAEPPR